MVKSKLSGLDGVRAIAIIMVILHHCAQFINKDMLSQTSKDIINFLLIWNVSLSIFFVLSGFLLSYPFWSRYYEGGEYPDIKQYFIKRAARIMPGFYFAIAVTLLISVLFKAPSQYTVIRFLAGITFTSGYHYITLFPVELNTPLWSSSFEVFCYILLPIFMIGMFKIISKKRSLTNALIYWAVVLAAMLFINKTIHIFLTPDSQGRGWDFGNIGGAKLWMPNYNPVGFSCQFIIGVLAAGISKGLYKVFDGFKKITPFWFDLMSVFFFAGSFIFIWIMKEVPECSLSFQNQPFFYPVYPMLIGLSMIFMPYTNIFAKSIDNVFLKFTAKVSFGLYLWHYLIMVILQKLCFPNFRFMGVDNPYGWISITFIVFVLSYCIATISYYVIEKPFIDCNKDTVIAEPSLSVSLTKHLEREDEISSKATRELT